MKSEEMYELLKGKTTKDIKYGLYLGGFIIESITFTDGTFLDLGGDDGYARIDYIVLPDGTTLEWEDRQLCFRLKA